jgi:hypothetical protein
MTSTDKIINGDFDSQLDDMQDAMNDRRKIVRQMTTAKNMMNIKVSDIVVLKGLTPKELNGRKGKVTAKKRSTISVKFTDGKTTSRFREGATVRVPAVCVERV